MRLGTYYRKKLLENLDIKTSEDDVVLDVGCFDGYWLSTQNAREKHAIDIDINPLYDNIKYQKGDATHLPYPDSYFDKVFAFDVIEHVEQGTERRFIEELLRVTKKGGEVIFTTPSKDIRLFPHFLTNWISKKWGHLKCNGYSKSELEAFIGDRKGIEIFELNSRGYLRYYLFLRIFWYFNKKNTKKMINKISINDSKRYGSNGYILVKIIK